MAPQPGYKDLVAWQRADGLFVRLHAVTREQFPDEERYCLTSQLRRAALSVAANIVEGSARTHGPEVLQFLRIAWGSLLEAGYYIHAASRLGYLDGPLAAELQQQVLGVASPLAGLIRRYRR